MCLRIERIFGLYWRSMYCGHLLICFEPLDPDGKETLTHGGGGMGGVKEG